MPSLERFFNPQMRVFSANITSLPGARLYFFEAGSTTPKVTYADKQGTTPNTNPVIASATGTFPPIFIDGLYRVELRSSSNIVQPGWPIDNVGQDTPIVPYAPWSELVTYAEFERVTDTLTGTVYRSTTDNNLGNAPADSPSDWEVVIDPVPSSFTSNAAYLSWSDDGGQISLDVDPAEFADNFISNAAWASFSNDAGKVSLDVDQIALNDELKTDLLGNDSYDRLSISTLGGTFTGGQIDLIKLGNVVTITVKAILTHASSSSVSSSVGGIPSKYRPTANTSLTIINGVGFDSVTVQSVGNIQINHLDSSFASVNRTTCPVFTISYVV